MKRYLYLLMLLLISWAGAQERSALDGDWQSATGADIRVMDAASETFVLVVKNQQGRELHRSRASWQTESTTEFQYRTPGGELILGVVEGETYDDTFYANRVELRNADRSWTAFWVRPGRH